MVIPLGEPAINDIQVITRIIEERNRGINRAYFDNKSQEWLDRVQLYFTVFGNPEIIDNTIIDDVDSGKFINLYLNPKPGSAQKTEVLDVIRSHGLDFCPSCGEAGYPRTLDHYLPKESFPEFSLLSRNLSPMCDMCQGAKLAKTVNSHGKKLFLHPYYDRLRDTPVLTAEIFPPYHTATTTRLKIRDDVQPESLRLLCVRHCDEMKIPARYDIFFRIQYLRVRNLIADKRNGNNLDVTELISLVERFRELFYLKSCNSWDYVFYSSVLENQDLLQFLSTGDVRPIGQIT